MPKISEFLGIAILVHWREHGPSHFHAVYAEYEASISIESLSIFDCDLPPRVLGLVTEWALLHHDELRQVWKQAQAMEPLAKIEPLR
mgnify:CR=1 FL=1